MLSLSLLMFVSLITTRVTACVSACCRTRSGGSGAIDRRSTEGNFPRMMGSKTTPRSFTVAQPGFLAPLKAYQDDKCVVLKIYKQALSMKENQVESTTLFVLNKVPLPACSNF